MKKLLCLCVLLVTLVACDRTDGDILKPKTENATEITQTSEAPPSSGDSTDFTESVDPKDITPPRR